MGFEKMVDYSSLRKKFPVKAGVRQRKLVAIKALRREYELKRAELGPRAPVMKKGIVFYTVLVLGLMVLGGLVLSVAGRGGPSRVDRARLNAEKSLAALAEALGRFHYHTGGYPTKDEGGLLALASTTIARKGWNGPYVSHIVADPWGNDYVYVFNGDNSTPTLYSKGPDGRAATTDDLIAESDLYARPYRDQSWNRGWLPYRLRGYLLAKNPEDKAFLEKCLADARSASEGLSRRPVLAIWDFDGTILDGDCSEGLVRNGESIYTGLLADCIRAGFAAKYQSEEGVRRFRTEYAAKIAAGHKLEAYVDCARIFAGAEVKEIEAFAQKRFEAMMAPHLYAYSYARFRELASSGVENHIVSASADFFVQAAARTLGISRTCIHGIRVMIKDGKLTGDVLEPIPFGEGKTTLVRELEQSSGGKAFYGFGNSYSTDGPFLKAIVEQGGRALMINGGNKVVTGMTELFIHTNLIETVGLDR